MSPVELFFLKRARRVHHNKPKRRRKLPPKQRAVVFETLEPRILLDAAPLMVDMAALGNDLTVKQTGANIEVLDNTSTVVASHAAADTSQVVVHGENGVDDSLAIDYSTPFFIDLSFDGGTGSGHVRGHRIRCRHDRPHRWRVQCNYHLLRPGAAHEYRHCGQCCLQLAGRAQPGRARG